MVHIENNQLIYMFSGQLVNYRAFSDIYLWIPILSVEDHKEQCRQRESVTVNDNSFQLSILETQSLVGFGRNQQLPAKCRALLQLVEFEVFQRYYQNAGMIDSEWLSKKERPNYNKLRFTIIQVGFYFNFFRLHYVSWIVLDRLYFKFRTKLLSLLINFNAQSHFTLLQFKKSKVMMIEK